MNAVVRKRRHVQVAEPCSCGCGALLFPGGVQLCGWYGKEPVTFAGYECFKRFLDDRRPS